MVLSMLHLICILWLFHLQVSYVQCYSVRQSDLKSDVLFALSLMVQKILDRWIDLL